jgi:hypothetical protein
VWVEKDALADTVMAPSFPETLIEADVAEAINGRAKEQIRARQPTKRRDNMVIRYFLIWILE